MTNTKNTYHSAIEKKPVDTKSNTYINSSKEINEKDPRFGYIDYIYRLYC